jgi:hypothetical protein
MTLPPADTVDWDALEEAGHLFMMVAPYAQGLSYYVCENCATFMITSGLSPKIEVWHHPHREDRSCEPRRSQAETLETKLAALQARMVDRLKDI